MRLLDLFTAAVRSLWRQKVRSALTGAGVAVGACALAFSVSLGLGLRHMIDDQFKRRADFWEVNVSPPGRYQPVPEAEIPPEKIEPPAGVVGDRRARVRAKLIQEYQKLHLRAGRPMTDDHLAELAAIPDVADVIAGFNLRATVQWKGQSRDQFVVAHPLRSLPVGPRVIAGAMPTSDDAAGVIVSENLLYDLGVRTDADLAAAVGQPLTLVLAPAAPFFPGVRQAFPVAAVFREPTPAERALDESPWSMTSRADVFLPAATGKRLWERLPGHAGDGYPGCTVRLTPGGDLRAVTERIEGLGYRPDSALRGYDSVKMEVTMIAAGLNLFAMISVAVAALGITNTLATSVVERTREIGILKAVGATRAQVLALFLTEGTVIGLLGGAVGFAVAWGLSIPGDGFVAKLIRDQSQGRFRVDTIFEFPLWLPAATVAFATVVTTLAAFFPARRAAGMQPIDALRSM